MRYMSVATLVAASTLCLLCTPAIAQQAQGHDHQHGAAKAPAAQDEHDHDNGHHHEAPHGGTLVAFGDEAAHLELVLDSAKGHLTGYVLDGEAVNAIRISQPQINLSVSGGDVASSAAISLKPVASPLTGEKAGNTSQFEAASAALKGAKKFTVTVDEITIKGQTFKGTKSAFPEGNH